MLTLKHSFHTNDINIIKDYQRQYFICFKIIYKYIRLGYNQRQIKELLQQYKHIDDIKNNSWLIASLFYKVNGVILAQKDSLKRLKEKLSKRKFKNYKQKSKLKKAIKYLKGNLCFNKSIHTQLLKELISKEEFKKLNNIPLCSVGDGLKHGNRLFRIIDSDTILFQPNRKMKIELKLSGHKNHKQILNNLKLWQENSLHPITYSIDENYIYITYDENYFKDLNYDFKENRVISIDLNPNFIGYSVIDWFDTENGKFKLIEKGVISQKFLNDYEQSLSIASTNKQHTYITNKRNYEVFQISKLLVEKAKHYRCHMFAIEDLSIESNDLGRGKQTNRLCNNQWNRVKLVNNLQKRCNLCGIEFKLVIPEYTSFIGNTVYRYLNLPDMILASIEISRRCYEYYLQYEKKVKQPDKIIRFPKLNDFVKDSIEKAKEALSIPVGFENYLQFYWYVKKNLGNKYRVPLDESKVFRQKHFKYSLTNNF